jgi:hypothetical protein
MKQVSQTNKNVIFLLSHTISKMFHILFQTVMLKSVIKPKKIISEYELAGIHVYKLL